MREAVRWGGSERTWMAKREEGRAESVRTRRRICTGWNGGDGEEAIYDGGVAIDGEIERGANGGRRGRDGDAAVNDVVDNLGAGWVE